MAWADLAKQAMDFLGNAATPESDSVDWSSDGAAFAAMRMQIDHQPEALGFSGDIGRGPIVAYPSKTDVTTVNEQRDRLRLSSGAIYRVDKVLSEDEGGFEVYCSPK